MKSRKQHGFTLVEIAMVILIVGLVTGALLMSMGGIADTAKFKEDQHNLKDIRIALLNHVSQKGYLPCPDTNGNGEENRTGNGCESHRGFLPHIDLNTHAYNAYNARFYYHIDNNTPGNPPHTTGNSSDYFDNSTPGTPKFKKDTPPGGISICENWNTTNNACEEDDGGYLAKNLPLVVVSFGKNSAETWAGSTNGTPAGCASLASGLEQLNCTDHKSFFQSHRIDDVLIWLSANDVKYTSGAISRNSPPNGDEDPPGNPHNPTTRVDDSEFADYDVNHLNNYNANHSIATSNDDDRINITQNVNRDINLLEGNNLLNIGQNLNASITAYDGDNILRIQGNANGGGINFGDGDNRIEVWGNLNTGITLGNGDNSVRIEGHVNGSGITMGTGINQVYVGGDINQSINGGGNAQSVFYVNRTPAEWQNLGWQQAHISGFGIFKCRETAGSATFVNC